MKAKIDFDYCRRAHGFETDEAVAAWFAKSDLPDLRTFSPSFSPIDYLFDHDDIRNAGANPIVHYLAAGHRERRKTRHAPRLRAYKHAASALRSAPPEQTRVAIVLHIYYASFVPYFCDSLLALDLPNWDVFISASHEVVEEHGAILSERLGSRLIELREVPNRGRNFAPLLVDFADVLGDYDAICHCHSKQSLYSGRRQSEWADYLIAALIGARDVVRRHVNLIAAGDCDLISPAPFAGMPPWASHTLSNDGHLAKLGAALDTVVPSGFMTYPVGGMFWMSRAIYRQLVSLNLTHHDFPPEPSHSDGELHHALERLIGHLAGRRLAYYDQVTGRYWAPESVLRAELMRFPNPDDLRETIKDRDLVTFDFFDTLCVRSTGNEEWAKARVEFLMGQNYVARRNALEARLRSELLGAGDVSLPMIATALASEGFADAARAVALERSLDLATLVPRPQVADVYEQAIENGKFVAIVSDSYYDRSFVVSFLRQHGMNLPNEILISSDLGLRKDRGDMWDRLSQVRGDQRALHIGDNVHSDIQKAAERGFETFYIPHWRVELLPFSGFSEQLYQRCLNNPAFARTIDRSPPEQNDDDISERYLDAIADGLFQRRRRRAKKSA